MCSTRLTGPSAPGREGRALGAGALTQLQLLLGPPPAPQSPAGLLSWNVMTRSPRLFQNLFPAISQRPPGNQLSPLPKSSETERKCVFFSPD